MTILSVVFQSGRGHTKVLAEAITKGLRETDGVDADLHEISPEKVIHGRFEDPSLFEALDASDGIVFGCATYMGSGSAIYKAFLEAAFRPQWWEQRWKDKIAAGFTNSASQSGDKLSTLYQLNVFAMQMGMIWVGVGDLPGNNWSGGSRTDLNRLGSWLGLMGQSNSDEASPSMGDIDTAERYGRRVGHIARRFVTGTQYEIERNSEEQFRELNLKRTAGFNVSGKVIG